MKKALILHGTGGYSKENWFDWLKQELESQNWQVWVPDLPQADHPNISRYNQYLFDNQKFEFDQDTIIVGHSSGSVAILGLLQALSSTQKVRHCYLVSAFKDTLGWDVLDGLFEQEFDYQKIKKQSQKFTLIHADNDPYIPLGHAEFIANQLDAQLIVKKGQKHFSTSTYGVEYKEFPFLLKKILEDN